MPIWQPKEKAPLNMTKASVKNESQMPDQYAAEHRRLQEKVIELQGEIDQLEAELDAIYTSKTWRWTAGIRNLASVAPVKLRQITRFLKRRKEWKQCRRFDSFNDVVAELGRGKGVIVFPQLVDWNIPLFQRPHHIAVQLGKLGYTYTYLTPNVYDFVDGYYQVAERVVVTNRSSEVLNNEFDILHVYSTDFMQSNGWGMYKNALNNKKIVLYEYIDELHSDITGKEMRVPTKVRQKHHALISNPDVLCITSATRLFEEVTAIREEGVTLVSNGVDISHFSRRRNDTECPPDIAAFVEDGPIVGYYGALAKWFDYELVRAVADTYKVLLIGWDYDGSLEKSGITRHPNVSVVGPIHYGRLPEYAVWFDVATIPFLINEITLSTSPIKVFEYMALDLPIVSTGLPECKNYQSVLTSSGPEEFIELIDKALKFGQTQEAIEARLREASENEWSTKAAQIDGIIQQRCKQMPDEYL